jgi:hypothetical protein
MSRSRKPRKPYDPSRAAVAAVNKVFTEIWNRCENPVNAPATLYHYCRAETFLKILESRNLWAPDIFSMKDKREVEYPFTDVIKPLVPEREFVASADQIREVWRKGNCHHIACFSSTAELPSQWKNYAECAGYAIGFNRDALRLWCNANLATLFPMI